MESINSLVASCFIMDTCTLVDYIWWLNIHRTFKFTVKVVGDVSNRFTPRPPPIIRSSEPTRDAGRNLNLYASVERQLDRHPGIIANSVEGIFQSKRYKVRYFLASTCNLDVGERHSCRCRTFSSRTKDSSLI